MSEIKLVKMTMEDFSKKQFEKLITEHATYKSLVEILQNQLQQKENIIKEVREYIEKHNETIRNRKELGVYGDFMIIPNELLEILDKENK